MGATTCFGETSELTGAKKVCAARAATPEVGEKILKTRQANLDGDIEPVIKLTANPRTAREMPNTWTCTALASCAAR